MNIKRQICTPLVAVILVLLPVITITADAGLISLSEAQAPLTIRAFFDSCIHIILGCLAWTCVIYQRDYHFKFRSELLFSAIFSAGINLDHFIAARSLYLNDALKMESPPPFHDMLWPLLCFMIAGVFYCAETIRRPVSRYRLLHLSVMMSVHFHLFRDAARRGLQVGFLWTIPPSGPYGLYPFFLPLFSLSMRSLLLLIDTRTEQSPVLIYVETNVDRNSPVSVASDDLALYHDPEQNYQAMFY